MVVSLALIYPTVFAVGRAIYFAEEQHNDLFGALPDPDGQAAEPQADPPQDNDN